MKVEIVNTVNDSNSIPQNAPTSAEILQFLAEIPRHIYDPAKRFIAIWIQTRGYVNRPEIREYLQRELDRAPHNAVSIEYEQKARALLDTQKTLFPNPIKIKIVRRRKAKAKTKINSAIRIDPELGRLAIALHESSDFRLWAISRDHIRQLAEAGKADNFITVESLKNALKTHGISYNRETIRLLLKSGQELGYWTRNANRLYIAGYKRVAAMLTRRAIDNGIPVDHDRPGARDWYIRVSGDIREFNAYVYAAWLASNAPHRTKKTPKKSITDNLTIARQTLQTLFNRERQTLQTWEGIAKIKVIENYAQTTEIEDTRIPEHAVSGNIRQSAESTTVVYRWQRPNTYQAPKKLREHGHKGQSRKVRKAVNAVCKTEQHPDSMAGAHSTRTRNFDTLKAFQATWRRDSRQDVPTNAHTDYLFLGDVRIRRRGKLIGTWELMGAHREPQTSAGDYEPMPRYQRAQYRDI